MSRVDIVPDWVIAVLAALAVAAVFKLFGGFGLLVLGIIATAVWIAQFIANIRSGHDHGTVSQPAQHRYRRRAKWLDNQRQR